MRNNISYKGYKEDYLTYQKWEIVENHMCKYRITYCMNGKEEDN